MGRSASKPTYRGSAACGHQSVFVQRNRQAPVGAQCRTYICSLTLFTISLTDIPLSKKTSRFAPCTLCLCSGLTEDLERLPLFDVPS